jgi:hypothetical protein
LTDPLKLKVRAALEMLERHGGRILQDEGDEENRRLRLQHFDGLSESYKLGLVYHDRHWGRWYWGIAPR